MPNGSVLKQFYFIEKSFALEIDPIYSMLLSKGEINKILIRDKFWAVSHFASFNLSANGWVEQFHEL